MMRTTRLVFALLLTLPVHASLAEIVFDDGGQHTITEDYVNEHVRVRNQTTVVHQGSFTFDPRPSTHTIVSVAEQSEFVVDGGRIDVVEYALAIDAQQDSRVTIQGGDIRSFGLKVSGSELNIAGGTLENWGGDFSPGNVTAMDSTVKVTGGEITNRAGFGSPGGIILGGTSTADITGGRITSAAASCCYETASVFVGDQATLVFGGGEIAMLDTTTNMFTQAGVSVDNDAKLVMNDGHLIVTTTEFSLGIGVSSSATSSVAISGGSISVSFEGEWPENSAKLFRAEADSEFTVSGGTFRSDGPSETDPPVPPSNRTLFEVADNATMTISGGTYLFDHALGIRAADASEVVILGSDFNQPMYEPIQDRKGTVTGRLLDGNDFSWTFERDATATITLVPEPSGVLPLGFGMLTMLIFACRRQ